MLSRLQSLKANIAVQLVFFFILAIILSDLAVITLVEKKLVKTSVSNTQDRLARLIETPQASIVSAQDIRNVFPVREVRTVYAEVPDADGGILCLGHLTRDLRKDVAALKARVVSHQKNAVVFAGREWGVFWLQERYALISVFSRFGPPGVAVIDFSLMYEMLRSSQKVAFWFLGLNLIVFVVLGTFRMARMITRPIHRYVKITESFADSGHFDFFPEKKDDEFSRLSMALNRMLMRIEDDTGRLKTSLSSLERANRNLKKTRDEMLRAEKLASVGRLSAGIAHEIGNPIGIILGYIGLLETRLLSAKDTEGLDFLKRAENEINRINRIIRQLLDFSRGVPEPTVRQVGVHRLIKDIGEFLRHQPLTSNIRVDYHLNAELDLVQADYDQLYQVLMNLLINAADSIAMSDRKDSGMISLETVLRPDSEVPSEDRGTGCPQIELRVCDNGTGIDPDHMDKIFDPFFSTKVPGKGTGLGLSVSYMIIERFGGTLCAQSIPGQGTVMKILLPVNEETDPEETDPEKTDTEEAGRDGA